MAENSKIEWTHHTFNPWRGCTKVSEGCKFCYAETMSGRNPGTLGVWGPRGTRVIAAESYWRQPLKWDAAAKAAGERHRVFCASLADVFEGPETMPADAWGPVEVARERLCHLIEQTPHLDWLLLTKRPQHIRQMAPPWWYQEGWPANVWIGTSVENQAAADERIPHLLRVPARVRFLSCEPLLGPVDLTFLLRHKDERCPYCESLLAGEAGRCFCGLSHESLIHWVIVGGESGGAARPMSPDWARKLRHQCEEFGIAFFFKQWGEFSPYYEAVDVAAGKLVMREYEKGVKRVGKAAAGRTLDGRTWDEVPA